MTSLVLVLLTGAAHAAPSSLVAWNQETLELLATGSPDRGAELAKPCASCHGKTGVSPSPDWPSLAGQLRPYLYKQLRDYKDGKRDNAVMKGMAGRLSDQDMADLAAFYAGQSLPEPENDSDGGEVAETLVRRGDGSRLIPACQGCHGRAGKGNVTGGVGLAAMPVLVGQYPAYLEKTLKDYRSGARANDVYGRMRSIAAELSDAEIEALAAHYGTRGSE